VSFGNLGGLPYALHRPSKKHPGPTKDLDIEVVVVDNASPDDAAEIAAGYPFVKLIRNDKNRGYGQACNQGVHASTGEVILFLNSDTRLPKSALIRLAESLLASGSIGAAGPYSNNVGYHQRFEPGYEDLADLDRFAQDFAMREEPDRDVPMLVGFCLAVRRSVLKEIGVFDPIYDKGLFEDNDLVYRILRANYRAVLCEKSYVYHEGSKSLNRLNVHPQALLRRNMALFESKWRRDLETGFASHLSGQQSPECIRFNPARSPEQVAHEMRKLRDLADVSICIIVKDEERNIAACLTSILELSNQIIVVDTGSTDRTKEICRRYPVELYESSWDDSFSVARNESLRHAKGSWIFWLDADDVMSFGAGVEMLKAAAYAPPNVIGYRMRVQFVGETSHSGTRVDHLKLFRNLPGVAFEGRIHEQILPSLRQYPGDIGLIREVVLHLNYDSSPEGQARKRIRDRRLLFLDYRDDPRHPFRLFNLGMTCHYTGKHRNAIRWLRRSLRRSSPDHTHVRACYALMGQSQVLLGELEAAEASFLKGLEAVGNDPELRYRLAVLYTKQERYGEAIQPLKAIPADTDGFYASLDIGILGYRKFALLAQVYEALGEVEEAAKYYRAAIGANPEDRGTICAFFGLAQTQRDLAAMQEAADALLTAEGAHETWARMEASIAEGKGQSPEEALWRLSAARPSAFGPLLVLSKAMLGKGEATAASELLKKLDEWGSAEGSELLGRIADDAGEVEKARWYYDRAVQLDPNREYSRQRISQIATDSGTEGGPIGASTGAEC